MIEIWIKDGIFYKIRWNENSDLCLRENGRGPGRYNLSSYLWLVTHGFKRYSRFE